MTCYVLLIQNFLLYQLPNYNWQYFFLDQNVEKPPAKWHQSQHCVHVVQRLLHRSRHIGGMLTFMWVKYESSTTSLVIVLVTKYVWMEANIYFISFELRYYAHIFVNNLIGFFSLQDLHCEVCRDEQGLSYLLGADPQDETSAEHEVSMSWNKHCSTMSLHKVFWLAICFFLSTRINHWSGGHKEHQH